eukprot:755229-Hanusia_phi.AAC.1
MVDKGLREAEQREWEAFKMAPDNVNEAMRMFFFESDRQDQPSKRPAQIEYECAQIEKDWKQGDAV